MKTGNSVIYRFNEDEVNAINQGIVNYPSGPIEAFFPEMDTIDNILSKYAKETFQPVEKPPGVRGPQPPEALIGFGDMRVKSAKSLA